ncbi:NmrA family NAD(P)-binding protein [Nonomuraea dietziae]
MIFVAGATENVGREVLRALIEAGAPVRALARAPAGA